MFEKEVEEYGHEHCCDSCKNLQAKYIKVFKDGAEFGYNKANEWTNVKDNLPISDKYKTYLVTDGYGSSMIARFYEDEWHISPIVVINDVVLWKEIILPSEDEIK